MIHIFLENFSKIYFKWEYLQKMSNILQIKFFFLNKNRANYQFTWNSSSINTGKIILLEDPKFEEKFLK